MFPSANDPQQQTSFLHRIKFHRASTSPAKMKGLLYLLTSIPLAAATLVSESDPRNPTGNSAVKKAKDPKHNHASAYHHRTGDVSWRVNEGAPIDNAASTELLALLARSQEICLTEAPDDCFNGCIATNLGLLGDGRFDYKVWELMILTTVASEETRAEAVRLGREAEIVLAGIETCQAGDWLVQIMARL
ncbi:hypothetical protein BO86DRAFT_183610 [Aspergillus japonicus CBS 114.51]|uniref:Uncharacterized protein n=2 Tax=Aspergillus TaxID=5052 RepID=A0A2V5HJU7_ASPV1|nr:hypothetical protein BO86DRAFT_183610 [Aspergillus japonicus CBS 114.51]PYI24738.1 hypothetical protein BO99DRAFT_3330 [Aspergillus violaceofuscus CBS 115571]RAH78319.1 hypothetical protein BO86DRAFT_183610 [Aspergillus japonicus CBS 114.51]